MPFPLQPRWRLLMAGPAALALSSCDPSDLSHAARAARAAIQSAERATRTGAAQPSPQPIPAGGRATAVSQETPLKQAWFERNFVQAYRRVGRRNPKWDAAAEAFMNDSLPRFMVVGIKPAPMEDVRARAHVLLDMGCDDPAVLYFAARALQTNEDESRLASELFERAVVGMRDVAYPRAVARYAASGLRADYDHRNEGTGKRAALDPLEIRWFLESLGDGSYEADDDLVLEDQLMNGTGESLFSRNRAAIVPALEAASWVDPWVRLHCAGMGHLADAADARGGDFANKVTREGWKGMEESVAAARKSLTEGWRLRPDRPENAAQMIRVGMLTGSSLGESPRVWFDRAVAAQFDYLPAYRLLIQALRTRWSGDEDALLAFARECADTRRFDTDVPWMTYVAVDQVEWDRIDEARPADAHVSVPPPPPPPSIYRDEDVYRMVSTVLERYRREPATFRWQWSASLQAAIAYKAGRYADAGKVLDDLGGVLDQIGKDVIGEPLPEARIETLASPRGADALRAEELYRAGHVEQAVPLFQKVRETAPATARPYVDQRLVASTTEIDLKAGRTVTLLPAKGLAGWTPIYGKWEIDKDGALIGTTTARGLLIDADARVGPDFEIEADIEIASTSNGQFQAGIVFGSHPAWDTRDWSSFRLKRTAHEGDTLYFSKHFYMPARRINRPVPLRNHVVIQSWDGRLWAYVNGEAVVTDYAPEWKPWRTADAQIGFGAYLDDNTVTIRHQNVRLRRLTRPPTPPSAPRSPAASSRGR